MDETINDGVGFAELLAASSLGDPEVHDTRRLVPAGSVAEVIARADRADPYWRAGPRALPTDPAPVDGASGGPAAEWEAALSGLLLSSGRSGPWLVDFLQARGLDAELADVAAVFEGGQPHPNSELIATIVEALGGRWEAGNYDALYQAARRAWTGAADPAVYRSASGISGAYVVDPRSQPAHQPPLHLLPARFHGRLPLVDRLAAAVPGRRGSTTIVLSGPIGCGKTALALEVARRVQTRHYPVLWLCAQAPTELSHGLREVALSWGATVSELDGLPGLPAAERCVHLWTLVHRLVGNGLLVIEDVDRAVGELVGRLQGGLDLLLTTRVDDLCSDVPDAWTVTVGPLEAREGAEVLRDAVASRGSVAPGRSDAEQRELEEISDRFGGVPLALRNIGILASVDRSAGLLDTSPTWCATGTTQTIEPVFAAALSAVERSGPGGARSTLRLLACVGDLPEELFDSLWPDLHGAVETLVRVALVERVDPRRAFLRVPRAFAELSLRDPLLGPAQVQDLQRSILDALLRRSGELDQAAPACWPTATALAPRAAELLDTLTADDLDQVADLARIVDRLARCLVRAGSQEQAADLVEHALTRCDVLPGTHPARFDLRRTQAWQTGLEGDLRRAEQLLGVLLQEQSRVDGPDAPSTLSTKDCFAWSLAEQGKLRPAQFRFQAALSACTDVLGPDHPKTLAVRHRLAWVDALLGKRGRAVREFKEVLAQRERRHGPDHLDVFSTRYRLAWALTLQGEVDEGERHYRVLLADVGRILPADHPVTMLVRWRVGWVLQWQSRLKESREVYRHLLVDQEKVLGMHHPRTLRTRHALACNAMHRGQLEDAVREFRGLIADNANTLGPDHRSTFDSRSYLAEALCRGGHFPEAERGFRAVLADRIRVFGKHSPAAFVTQKLLVGALIGAGRLDEADAILAALEYDVAGLIEPMSRLVFDIRQARARLTALQGRPSEAETMLRRLLVDQTEALSPDHREILESRYYLVWVLGLQGKTEEAEWRCRQLHEECSTLHGPDHPDTLAVRNRRAVLSALAGRRDQARAEFGELVEHCRRVLGSSHPAGLQARLGYAWSLRLTGDALVERVLRDLLRDVESVLGPQAVLTLRTRDALGLVLLEAGRLADAEALYRALREETREHLGIEHGDFLLVSEHLARVWHRMGRIEDARAVYAMVARGRARFDSTHVDVRRAVRNQFLGGR